jgi:threonine/homoserine/homoserine lactone efflux protein
VGAIFSLFTQGVTLGFSAAASPGPFQAFLFAHASRHGVRRTLPLVLAPLVSDVPIVAVILLALSRVPEGFLRGLEVAGGAGPGGSFARAVVVNATGPGPWIFWSTVCGPILAEAWRAGAPRALAFLLGFYGLLVGGKAVLVVAYGLAGRIGPRTARGLGLASAAAMAAMGALQLWRGLSGR